MSGIIHDSKGIAPSFESHFKEPNRNFEMHHHLKCFNKSKLDSNGFTNLEVILNKRTKYKIRNCIITCNIETSLNMIQMNSPISKSQDKTATRTRK